MGQVIPEAAEVDSHTLAALPAAAAIVHRVAPWARCYAVPRLQGLCDGEDDFRYLSGLHRWKDAEDSIILGLLNDEEYLINTAYHESFHAVDRFIAPLQTGILNAAAAQGFSYSEQYLRHPREQLARGFASWAMARLECPPEPGWRATASVEKMFSQVESGEMAALVMGARAAA